MKKSKHPRVLGSTLQKLKRITLEVILHTPLLQHLPILIQQPTVISIVLSRTIPHLRMIIKPLHRRRQLPIHQIRPRKKTQPRMLLYLLHTCPTQSLNRLPLQQFVHKISSLHRPTLRNLPLSYHHLLLFNPLLYLLPRLTQIRPPPHHNLVYYHPQRIKIDLVTMIMMKHHLRSHIPRSTRSVLTIISTQMLSNPQISQIGKTYLKNAVPSRSNTMFSGFRSR